MNVRQGSLLRELLDATEFRTCDCFANSLGCSEKTVRTDVKAIDAFLEHEGFVARVQGRRGAGIRLTLAQSEANRLSSLLDEYEVSMRPRIERLCQEIILLTCAPGVHTVEKLAKRLYTNKQQIQVDLRWWQTILAPRGIALKTGRTITVDGAEWIVRGFIMSVLFAFSSRAVQRRIEPALTGGETHDQGFYERSIDDAQDALGFRFSSNARWQLIVYLKIMVARIKLGHTITSHSSIRGLSPFFSELRLRFERHFGIKVTLAEMHLLQDMHDCCTWQWSSKLMEQYEPDPHAVQVAREIIAALGQAFGCDPSAATLKPLAILVESGLVRRACGFVIPNPNEPTVKYDTMDSFCLLSSVLADVESIQQAALYSADYTRIALVLLEYLEQIDYQRRYRAGLVVNCGIDLALYGKHRIEKLISKVRIADIVTENEVQAACARADSALSERFDFLITFDPVAVDFPCVSISSTIDERDIERIIAAIPLWKSGCEVELPWEHRKLRHAAFGNAIVRSLYDDLVRVGVLDMSYDAFVWQFDTLSFVKGRTLVLTLCGTGVEKTCALLYQTEGEAQVLGRRCSMAAILLVRIEDRGDLTPATEQFKRLLEFHADIADTDDDDPTFPNFPE